MSYLELERHLSARMAREAHYKTIDTLLGVVMYAATIAFALWILP